MSCKLFQRQSFFSQDPILNDVLLSSAQRVHGLADAVL